METEYELVEKALDLDENLEFEKAYELWVLLADEYNNPTAYFFLGSYFQHGIFVNIDYKKAKDYYFLGAKVGDADCICNLGYCFEFGLGLKKSKKKAFDYYKKAAKLGNESAIYNLANCYILGDGVEKNVDLAIKYYEQISDSLSIANLRLGNIFSEGVLKTPDYKRAINYYKKGDMMNNAECTYNLACLLDDPEESFNYMEKAANLGFSKAMSDLGYYYQTGYGVVQDEIEGYEWFCKAADLFDPLGSINKAVCLREGIGVVKDEKEAFKIFKLGETFEDPNAYFNLGVCYETGSGVRKSISKALYYYNLVDSVESDVRKAKIYRNKKNYEKALSYYMLRSEESPEACYYLAEMLRKGEGCNKNIEEAIYYYKKLLNVKDTKAYIGLIHSYLALDDEAEALRYLNEGIEKKNIDCIIAKFNFDKKLEKQNYMDILINNIDLDPSIKLELAKEYFIKNKNCDAKKMFEELRANGILEASYYLGLMTDNLEMRKKLFLESKSYFILALLSLDNLRKAISYAKKAINEDDYLAYVLYVCLMFDDITDSNLKIVENINKSDLYEIIKDDFSPLAIFVKGILKYYGLTTTEDQIEAKSLFKIALSRDESLNELVLKNKYLFKFSLTTRNK